jgi:hypothetical protein
MLVLTAAETGRSYRSLSGLSIKTDAVKPWRGCTSVLGGGPDTRPAVRPAGQARSQRTHPASTRPLGTMRPEEGAPGAAPRDFKPFPAWQSLALAIILASVCVALMKIPSMTSGTGQKRAQGMLQAEGGTKQITMLDFMPGAKRPRAAANADEVIDLEAGTAAGPSSGAGATQAPAQPARLGALPQPQPALPGPAAMPADDAEALAAALAARRRAGHQRAVGWRARLF